jgi:hypothetical protein
VRSLESRTGLKPTAFAVLLAAAFALTLQGGEPGGFLPAKGPVAQKGLCVAPAVNPPSGSLHPICDIFGNYWTLARAAGGKQLMVLPAQLPATWVPEDRSGLAPGPWKFVVSDEDGFLFLASQNKLARLNPQQPQKGWTEISSRKSFPKEPISAIGVAPSGALAVAFSTGKLAEVTESDSDALVLTPAPQGITQLIVDDEGALWVKAGNRFFRRPPASDAWQRHWQLVARMVGSDKDIRATVVGTKLYIAGGVTATWGYPVKQHAFTQLFEFNAESRCWRTASYLGYARCYNATTHLDRKIWVIGGDIFPAGSTREAVRTVQICDPATGTILPGPNLPAPLPTPLAVHIDGRIYVAGAPRDKYDKPGMLLSIGRGETAWRREPDGPAGMASIVGTSLEGKFYIVIPHVGLAIYDTRARSWQTVPMKPTPRSCQIAAYKGEIWLMGGRDIPDGHQVLIFNPKDGQFRPGPSLPRALAWGGAATVGGRLTFTGGATGSAHYSNRTYILRDGK